MASSNPRHRTGASEVSAEPSGRPEAGDPTAAPAGDLEKLIVSRKLAHGGNPVTRWMAANVAVAQDPAGNLKPAKDKSTEHIGGIVAMVMAIGRAIVAMEQVLDAPTAL